MDNVTRFYIAEYEEAYRLATAGEIDHALDICFSLRLRPDLSLYIRATLNILLGSIAKEDNRRYLREALELIKDIREENKNTKEFPELDELEREAVSCLDDLGDEGCSFDREERYAGGIEGMYGESLQGPLEAAEPEIPHAELSPSSTPQLSQLSSIVDENLDARSEGTSIPSSPLSQKK